MDFEKWQEIEWELEQYREFEQEAIEDLKQKLEAVDMVLVKTLPTDYRISAVVSNANNTKWIHVLMPDVRENEEFHKGISLRRMSSERDWKGDCFHYCAWDELGPMIVEYMGDQYDDEED